MATMYRTFLTVRCLHNFINLECVLSAGILWCSDNKRIVIELKYIPIGDNPDIRNRHLAAQQFRTNAIQGLRRKLTRSSSASNQQTSEGLSEGDLNLIAQLRTAFFSMFSSPLAFHAQGQIIETSRTKRCQLLNKDEAYTCRLWRCSESACDV